MTRPEKRWMSFAGLTAIAVVGALVWIPARSIVPCSRDDAQRSALEHLVCPKGTNADPVASAQMPELSAGAYESYGEWIRAEYLPRVAACVDTHGGEGRLRFWFQFMKQETQHTRPELVLVRSSVGQTTTRCVREAAETLPMAPFLPEADDASWSRIESSEREKLVAAAVSDASEGTSVGFVEYALEVARD